MKKSKTMWFVIGLTLLNLLMLALTQVGSVKRLMNAKLSYTVLIESAVFLVLAAIPGVNLVALVLVVPIVAYNFITRMPVIIKAFATGTSNAGTGVGSGGQSPTDAENGIWTTPQTSDTGNGNGEGSAMA